MSSAAAIDDFKQRAPVAWRSTLSGLCASLVGIGLALVRRSCQGIAL